ncbi:response regulator [Lyngbya aestuarii]|uniref:response regulator n=1 Tax=Lyngbya aestuarii TaxID=118322 RepID=UPI00403D9117
MTFLIKHLNPENFLILVVDDINQNLQVIGDILEEVGYETTFATSGKQAIERIKKAKPDLILLDLMMPEMDGLEVCNQLKMNLLYRSIPIIFITASHEQKYLVKAFKQGAVDYITKPFQGEEVLVRIENQLRLRLQEQQLQQFAQQEQEKATKLEATLQKLKQTQTQLIQAKKMSSLNQIVAGIAHEINNPINFISGNLYYVHSYFHNLLSLVQIYQEIYPNPCPQILQCQDEMEFNFLKEDWQSLINSMQIGAERISQLILSLRRFSQLDNSNLKSTNIQEEIDNILMLLQYRLSAVENRPEIQVIKQYNQLPKITCYTSQLNQVFMNLLSNAIEALDEKAQDKGAIFQEPPTITISTEVVTNNNTFLPTSNVVAIQIADNGCGINQEAQQQIFDPFFTTKPLGNGMGLGLAISYQIVVDTHKGDIRCISFPGKGTQMIVEIPTSNF